MDMGFIKFERDWQETFFSNDTALMGLYLLIKLKKNWRNHPIKIRKNSKIFEISKDSFLTTYAHLENLGGGSFRKVKRDIKTLEDMGCIAVKSFGYCIVIDDLIDKCQSTCSVNDSVVLPECDLIDDHTDTPNADTVQNVKAPLIYIEKEKEKYIEIERDTKKETKKGFEVVDVADEALRENISSNPEIGSMSTDIYTAPAHELNNGAVSPSEKKKNTFTPEQFIELWNDTLIDFPKCQKLTKIRLTKLKARIKENPKKEYWINVFETMKNSNFLSGSNDRGWQADIDFLIKSDSTSVFIMEGKYSNKERIVKPIATPVRKPFKLKF